MLDLLQILVTALHLTAVNAAFGGPILALWLFWRARCRGDAVADAVGMRLLRGSIHGLYAGIVLGFLAAWLWWTARPQQVTLAFRSLPHSRYAFTVGELVFSAVCFEAWLAIWRRGSSRPVLAAVLAVLAITNTVYHFPTLFSILSVLSTRTSAAVLPLRFVSILVDPEVLIRVAHFSLASLAVAGAMLMALAAVKPRRIRREEPSTTRNEETLVADAQRLKSRGALVALVCTLLQWPVGVIVMLQLPEAARDSLLGHDVSTTTLFALSLGAVVMLMHRLATAAFGESSPAEVRSGLLWLGITIALMTAVRHFSREPLYVTPAASTVRASTFLEPRYASHTLTIRAVEL
ncbi:MAG: hypothetical protein JNK76_15415 [Planctomycetales bacterium]|nr:hypothetical protein [Planctomycetales bacterium]MBN8626954.1 hypothetical protein [Planctomycetota bacterium]